MDDYKDLIDAFSASCRVDAKDTRGSCTIIYSKDGETFALTNFHVIANNIKYGTSWDPLLQRDKKTELRDVAQVLFPRVDKNNDIIGYSDEIFQALRDLKAFNYENIYISIF